MLAESIDYKLPEKGKKSEYVETKFGEIANRPLTSCVRARFARCGISGHERSILCGAARLVLLAEMAARKKKDL